MEEEARTHNIPLVEIGEKGDEICWSFNKNPTHALKMTLLKSMSSGVSEGNHVGVLTTTRTINNMIGFLFEVPGRKRIGILTTTRTIHLRICFLF